MLHKIIEYLNTIKRYSGRIFIKFERDEGGFEISLCVGSIRVFGNFSDDPYYEPLVFTQLKFMKATRIVYRFEDDKGMAYIVFARVFTIFIVDFVNH